MPRTALTLRLHLALTVGPTPIRDDDLDDRVLREAWVEHRARLLASHPLDSQPWAWWVFEPGVPEWLRGQRPQLVEVAGGNPLGPLPPATFTDDDLWPQTLTFDGPRGSSRPTAPGAPRTPRRRP